MTITVRRAAAVCVFNLLALVGAAMVCLVLTELWARWVLDDGMRYDFEMQRYASLVKTVTPDRDLPFVHRPHVSARIMGADVMTNDKGMRDNRHFPQYPDGNTTRVLMLGDSVTFGFGVPSDATTSSRLEEKLARGIPGRAFEVINAGVGNYNTQMEVEAYLKLSEEIHPDVVILNFFVNDAEATPRPKPSLLDRYSLGWTLVARQIDSVLRTFGSAPDWQRYYASLYEPDQPDWLRTKKSIGRLATSCKQRQTPLFLVSYPDLHQVSPYPFDVITTSIASVAQEWRIPFLDLLPAVRTETDSQRIWVHSDDPHPNVEAHRRYAERLGDWLLGEHVDILLSR